MAGSLLLDIFFGGNLTGYPVTRAGIGILFVPAIFVGSRNANDRFL
ncbi:hypothetical protein ACLUEY_02740 [Vreelandella aquamarina]